MWRIDGIVSLSYICIGHSTSMRRAPDGLECRMFNLKLYDYGNTDRTDSGTDRTCSRKVS